jgi:ferredoxin--NADP+ reductase
VAGFADDRTPDLQFDHIVFASTRGVGAEIAVDITESAAQGGRVRLATVADLDRATTASQPADSAESRRAQRRQRVPAALDELRTTNYNATITSFDRVHDDLWILRVRPDDGGLIYRAGQYASLGLGYWEQRVDDATDADLDSRWDKLIRRSYSISSRIFDQHGYLVDDTKSGELELYIVLVAPSAEHVPGLTPRLALKGPGERIFLGTKVAGRYNLGHVTDPETTVLFLATGTGESPHNAMVAELLQRGHRGPIVSAVSVRHWNDLAYRDKHQLLDRLHHNYHYLPLPTRERDTPKQYLQDLISSGTLETDYGVTLDPATTHVFLCGNPLMIGLPETVDGRSTFPASVGVVELLSERGFVLDQPGAPGNVHFEEYW